MGELLGQLSDYQVLVDADDEAAATFPLYVCVTERTRIFL
jgi:hypothetical protein